MRRLLFAGDSVTDCGRTFFDPDVASGHLGDGWVRVVAALLGGRRPGVHEVLNAGVAGDRVADLTARWERDVVSHAPQVLTILIGVNDVLLEPRTDEAAFERDYRRILEQVPPSVERLVIAEPFVLPVDERTEALRATAEPHLEIVRALAAEVGAVRLPLAKLFGKACQQAPPAWWAADGIHPTAAGHGFLAEMWLVFADAHL